MTTPLESTAMSELFEESKPIEFPAGLIGLNEWKHFVLVTHPDSGPLGLLQSLDDAPMSLIVVDPRQVVSDYQLSLSEADMQALQLPAGYKVPVLDGGQAGVYCILSVQAEPFKVTANLLGPVVINWPAGLGRQVILSNSGYNPRFPIASEPLFEGLNSAPGKETE
ncbi:MAG: flagellar assembly protein FliW [Anaerolineae bacterium]|nr:flagellar assembly protein FliW [Anaerolineae bacterium]